MKLLPKSLAIISSFALMSALADAPRYSKYNASLAVNYAKTWALKKNVNFPDFEKQGGDCTNFAGQVLHTGGWQYTASRVNTDYATWYVSWNGSKYLNSQTWSVADALHRRLVLMPQEKSAKQITNVEDLSPGDIVFMVGSNKLAHHTMVVTDKVTTGWLFWKSTDILVSYHNGAPYVSKFNTSLKDIIATSSGDVFKFVKISA